MDKQDPQDLTKRELLDMARLRDVPGRSGMSKDELVEALREVSPPAAPSPPNGANGTHQTPSQNAPRPQGNTPEDARAHAQPDAHDDEGDSWNRASGRDPNYGRFLSPGGGNRHDRVRPGGHRVPFHGDRPGGRGNDVARGPGRPNDRMTNGRARNGGPPPGRTPSGRDADHRRESLAERSERGRSRATEKSQHARDALQRSGEARRGVPYVPRFERNRDGDRDRNRGRDQRRDQGRDDRRPAGPDSRRDRNDSRKDFRGARSDDGPRERAKDNGGRDRWPDRNPRKSSPPESDLRFRGRERFRDANREEARDPRGFRGGAPANPRERLDEVMGSGAAGPQPGSQGRPEGGTRPSSRGALPTPKDRVNPLESLGVVGPVDDVRKELASLGRTPGPVPGQTPASAPGGRASSGGPIGGGESGASATRGPATSEPSAEEKLERRPSNGEPLEFPGEYDLDRCRIIARDPYWIHAYWDLSRDSLERLYEEVRVDPSEWRVMLRVHSMPVESAFAGAQPAGVFDVEVGETARSWYLHVGIPNRMYRVDVGIRMPDGSFHPLVQSNKVLTPPDRMSDEADPRWSTSVLEARRLYDFSGGSPVRNIATGPSVPGGEVSDPPPRPRETGRPEGELGATEPKWEGKESWGSSPARSSKTSGKNEFRFHLNAELLLSGMVDAGTEVRIQGVPVLIQEDGTFRVKLQLPDGDYEVPVEAISPDHRKEVRIVPRISRRTEVEERDRRPK